MSCGTVWELIERTDLYRRWWPWLELRRCDGLEPGDVTEAWLRAPLGYGIDFVVLVVEREPGRRLVVSIEGDIQGHAVVELSGADPGCVLELRFDVRVRRRLLVALSGIAHRPLAWGHDRVIARAAEQFRASAIGGR